jgi:hypothetical protein
MNIQQFAKKPELVKIEITDPAILETYGEAVSFWIYDNVDISTYFDFFKSQSDGDGEKIYQLIRQLVRDESGNFCIPEDHILPIDLAIACLTGINANLGKSKTKSLTPATGNQ